MNTKQPAMREGVLGNRQGFALVTVILVVMVVAVMVTGAAIIGSTHTLSNRYYERQGELDRVALAGLEYGRAVLNGSSDVYPDSGYVVLENGVVPTDAAGNPVSGVQRWTYAGPTGVTSGQYGVFGSVVSVARDGGGGVAIRRAQVFEESFARYAYFTDIEPANISFGGGDQIFGPVHTNDDLKIYSSGARFRDEARTAGEVVGEQWGTFDRGYEEGVPMIPMPETAELDALEARAASSGASFSTPSPGGSGEANLRIEFVALDLDGDGQVTGENEGFFKVYRSNDATWLSGDRPNWGMRFAEHCGHYHSDGTFVSAADHPGPYEHSPVASLSNSTKRCYLGGSDELFGGFVANDGNGAWVQWSGTPDPLVAGRPDAQYLFPLSRSMNPDFQGVIHVDGKVVVSGRVRGRVTLAATDEIIIGDDLVYATDPGVGTCVDILGLFGGTDIVVADNTLNTAQNPGSGSNEFTYDETPEENIHAIVLALDQFTVENFAGGPTRAEPCEGSLWGRGCLYLTGGIIQNTRGAVGTILSTVGGTGYVKRYAYDRCGATAPPPYFPTTGHFTRGQRYWVDPAGFDVADYFDLLTAGTS